MKNDSSVSDDRLFLIPDYEKEVFQKRKVSLMFYGHSACAFIRSLKYSAPTGCDRTE